eukprot:Tbor_TRINITY_DN92_c0_g1::TRINITY_DN92_c0_g1_i1::g.15153::m.15153
MRGATFRLGITHSKIMRCLITEGYMSSSMPSSTNTMTVGDKLRQQLEVSTSEALVDRLGKYSKDFISPEQLPVVTAILDEVTSRRVSVLTIKEYRDVIHLAFISGNHEMVLRAYKERLTSSGKDIKFTVYDLIVESAYYLERVNELKELAFRCRNKLQDSPREVIADFSLCRCFWRLVCLSTLKEADRSLRKEALEAAETVWNNCICDVSTGLINRISAKEAITETRRHILYSKVAHVSSSQQHANKHRTRGENGEMAFFQMCKRKNILRTTSWSMTEKKKSDNFWCGLIRTCRAGKYSEVALEYLEELREPFTEDNNVCHGFIAYPEDDLSFEIQDLKEEIHDSNSEYVNSSNETLIEGNTASHVIGVSELVLYATFAILQHAKDYANVVTLGKRLLRDPNTSFSRTLWVALSVAAGEVRDLPLAIDAFHAICDSESPTPFAVYSSLLAISKCHTPDFEQLYLQVSLARGLISNDQEIISYLILLNGLTSVDPLSSAHKVLKSMQESGTSISVRVSSLIFKILLRCESPEFLAFYKKVVDEFGLFKSIWVEELILWADRRRYFLSKSDRKYILDEAKRNFGVSDVKSDNLGGLEKLRTHLAGIQHDYLHDPLAGFLKDGKGWISPEPSFMDSRMHFLVKKKACIESTSEDLIDSIIHKHQGILHTLKESPNRALMDCFPAALPITQDDHKDFIYRTRLFLEK